MTAVGYGVFGRRGARAPFLLESYTGFPMVRAQRSCSGFWALLRTEWERERHEGHEGGEGHEGSSSRSSLFSIRPWFLHGLALALLPWMHTRFSVLAATLGGLILVRLARVPNAMAKAIAFLLPPAVSAVAWMFFFAVLYGVPDPSAPYGSEPQNFLAFLPNGLGGLLFDQGFGLLATAPVLVAAFAGFTRTRRLFLEWCVVAAPYALTVTTYAMWWAGMSGPARFLVPLILPLAIPAACAWAAASRGWRSVMLAALLDAGSRRHGGRRRRTARVSHAQRRRPHGGAVDGMGDARRRSAVGGAGVRAAAGGDAAGRARHGGAVGIRGDAPVGLRARRRGVRRCVVDRSPSVFRAAHVLTLAAASVMLASSVVWPP
jgi:hypothetical protein